MAIRVRCPNGHKWKVKASAAGTPVACPRCQVEVPVPPRAAGPRPAPLWLRLLVFQLLVLALVSPVAAVFALGKLGQSKAGTVAHAFLDAFQQDNPSAAAALLAAETAKEQGLEAYAYFLGPGQATYQINELVVKGEVAEVAFTRTLATPAAGPVPYRGAFGKEQKGKLELHWENGEWRVQLLAWIQDGKEWSSTKSFRKSFLTTMNHYRLRPLPRVEGVERRQFEAFWARDFDLRNQPGGEVLEALAKELGLPLTVDPKQGDELARPVTFRKERCSPLEAIEEVCRQLGFYPHYGPARSGDRVTSRRTTTPPAAPQLPEPVLTLERGPRPAPMAIAGPYLIEDLGIQEYIPHATGLLRIRIVAPRLPQSVRQSTLKGDPQLTMQVHDGQGNDLYYAEEGPISPQALVPSFGADGQVIVSAPLERGLYREATFGVPLKNLVRGLSAVASVKGRLPLVLPTHVERVRFEQLTAGTTRESGALRVTLQKVGPWSPKGNESMLPGIFPMKELVLAYAGTERRLVELLAFDGEGRALGGTTLGTDAKGTFTWPVPEATASVEVQMTVALEELAYEFQLQNLPLTGRMPERIEPVHFPGHAAPVTVEFNGWMDGPGGTPPGIPGNQIARVRAINHSDKDVVRLHLLLTFLDANGKVVQEQRYTHQSGFTYPGMGQPQRQTVIARGQQSEFNVTAGKSEIKDLTIKLLGVVFVDATTWKP